MSDQNRSDAIHYYVVSNNFELDAEFEVAPVEPIGDVKFIELPSISHGEFEREPVIL